MFSAYCEHCRTEQLLSARRIERLHHDAGGILVVYRCWNGHRGTWRTGRAGGRRAAATLQRPAASARPRRVAARTQMPA